MLWYPLFLLLTCSVLYRNCADNISTISKNAPAPHTVVLLLGILQFQSYRDFTFVGRVTVSTIKYQSVCRRVNRPWSDDRRGPGSNGKWARRHVPPRDMFRYAPRPILFLSESRVHVATVATEISGDRCDEIFNKSRRIVVEIRCA